MSRFNFNHVIPQVPSVKPVLPQFTKDEINDLLKHCNFASQDLELLKAILSDGNLLSLDELHNIYGANGSNKYYRNFKANSAESLREISDTLDLINDINLIMCLDRDVPLSKERRFVWSEIRIIEISPLTKRLVLAIHCNTEKQITHQEAWGYTKKSSNTNNNNNKNSDPFA